MPSRIVLQEKVLDKEYVTIRYNPSEKLLWNEWRGNIPSKQLREAINFACEFIVANNVALILADYTRMHAPSREDQVWIARNSAAILQHSKLRKVANIMGNDIFQQISIETIYEIASKTPMPCDSQNFVSKEDALDWLLDRE